MLVGHVGLNVKEIDRSTRFYKDIFGYDVIGQSNENGKHFAFLGKEGQPKLTLWQQSNAEYNKEISGLHHLAFQADSVEQVERIQQNLKELGVKFIYDGIVPHAEGARSGGIFFEDPDGIRLEVYAATGAEKYDSPSEYPSCGFF
ncbi:MAG TPA: VOC family protein [Acidobacteriota bacterium]